MLPFLKQRRERKTCADANIGWRREGADPRSYIGSKLFLK